MSLCARILERLLLAAARTWLAASAALDARSRGETSVWSHRGEGACRVLAEHVDIRTIQLMLGHADIKQTQRYLNITDEELRKAMTDVWERRRQLRAVSQ
jgi:site-specific recombinase XerD